MSDTTMTAGRELDALVAERVMGWRNPREWWPWPESGVLLGQHVGVPPERAPARTLSDVADVPRYSTDIAAAWQIAEHFRRERWYVAIGDDADGREWFASIGSFAEVGAETAPLALCRAALIALEHADDE